MRRLLATATLVALTSSCVLAGCGGEPSDPRTAVVDAVKASQTAAINRDPGAYCDVLSGRAKLELIARTVPLGAKEGDCESAAAKLFELSGAADLERLRAVRDTLTEKAVKITGERAMLRTRRRLVMLKAGDDWLVDRIIPRRQRPRR